MFQSKSRHRIVLWNCWLLLGLLAGPTLVGAQTPPVVPTDEQVDKLIKDLQEAIFKFQVDQWAILKGVKGTNGVVGPPADNEPKPEMYANVIPSGDGYDATDAAGKTTKYDKSEVYYLQPPGHFQPDFYRMSNPGGFTTMALWALVASDFPNEDPRMQKALKSYFEGSMSKGTYTMSFRLNILSHLIRFRPPNVAGNYKKYIDRETDVMVKTMGENGQYTYLAYPPRGYTEDPPDSWKWKGKPVAGGSDNSNTQFAPFGISASEDALVEVDPMFWQKQDEWWQSCQQQDGKFMYQKSTSGGDGSDVNMTDAGMNSLYLVVDKLYSHQTLRGYVPLKGFEYKPEARQKMMKDFACIAKAFAWMEATGRKVPTPGNGHTGYHFYGLQRVGLNSGRKYIGGRPWFEEVVKWAYVSGQVPVDVTNGQSLHTLAWRLLCLAFGRAPVLFNKLDTGDEADWNYYVEDMDHLTDWLNVDLEKRYNWQVVDLKHELFDFQDAPILYISGDKALNLNEDALNKIKAFCDFGGTVFLHPVHDSAEFKKSVKDIFTKLYAKEGYEFSDLPVDHPLYVGSMGKDTKDTMRVAKNKAPLSGMSDGGRHFIFLVNGDIAGAWQLLLNKTQRDLFVLMRNLRMYAAPMYNDMPGKLRPRLPNLGPGPNKVVVARLKHNGHSTANARLYEALGFTMSTNGYGFEVREDAAADETSLKGVHVIHITGHNNFTFKPPEVAAIKKAVEGGAFLLIDPAYGRKEFLSSAETLVKQLGLTEENIVPKEHALFKGIEALKPNRGMAGGIMRAFKELRLNDKPVGLLSTVDITAAACGHYVFGNPGIGTDASRKLWVNIAAMGSKIAPVAVIIPGVPQAPTPTPAPAPKPAN